MKTKLMLVVILLFVLTACYPSTDLPNAASNHSALGKELIFPAGWKLAQYGRNHGVDYFICENRGRYRYCTPEIKNYE